MKRPLLAALAPLLLACTLSGCQFDTWEGVLDENPATEKAFWAGAVVGGTPAMVAASPVTVPLCLAGDSGYNALFLLLPGLPTGLVGGVTLGLPVLVLETIARLPRRIWEHARGRREHEAHPEPDLAQPEPASPYRNWPKPGPVPKRPY